MTSNGPTIGTSGEERLPSEDTDDSDSTSSTSSNSGNGEVVAAAAEAAGVQSRRGSTRSDWRLDTSGRYQHRKAYLIRLANEAGFGIVSYEKVVARRRHSSLAADPILAHLFVLELNDVGATTTPGASEKTE